MRFDALLLLSFGGPEGPDDVIPFLQNVVRGRPVPSERLEQVAGQYMRFGGRSPINDHNRSLLHALTEEFASRGRDLPVYWGNRNWAPYVADTVARMRDDGVRRAAVFVTSAYSSYSSCRQYLEDLERARREVGSDAPELVKLRPYFDHPGFVEPLIEGLADALRRVGPDAPVLMSAHSIPSSMAATCAYEEQLRTTAALVATGAGLGGTHDPWRLVFQSRSGSPAHPWLGPDVLEVIADLPQATGEVVVVPVGFVSDHMEVVHDLDTQAAGAAADRGIRLVRSATPGTHPRFVRMVCELLAELEEPDSAPRLALGPPARRPLCGEGCCPAPAAGPRPGLGAR